LPKLIFSLINLEIKFKFFQQNREKREQQPENLDSTSETQGTTKPGYAYDAFGIISSDEPDSTSSSSRDPPLPPPTLKAQDPSTEEPKTSTLMPTTIIPTTPAPTTTTPKPTTHKPTKAHKTTKKAIKYFINLQQPQGNIGGGQGKLKAFGRLLIPSDTGSA